MRIVAIRCPPCKQIKPIYEEMSTEHTSVAFGKVDVDDNSEAAQEFEITSVPQSSTGEFHVEFHFWYTDEHRKLKSGGD